MIRDKNFGIIVCLLLISGIISWVLYFKEYTQVDTVDITKFPKSISGWTAEDLPISKEEYDILETHNVVARRYKNIQNEPIYLLIVYSQHNRKISHPPEVCYTGGGVTILENVKDKIPVSAGKNIISANRLLLELRGTKQFSYYWFKVGDSFTANYWNQQALIAVKTLFGQPHSSALIRISSDISKNDEKGAIDRIKYFTNLILNDLNRYLP